MRITTRIALGLALLAGLATALVGYQLANVHTLHDITRQLSDQLVRLNGVPDPALVETSSATADRLSRVSTTVAFMAAGLFVLGAAALYLSVARPVRRLRQSAARETATGASERRLTEEVPTDLAELARNFNEMAERLGELETLKREFVSHVSHELKGPLAAIHETILILLEEIPGPLNPKQAHLLQLSHRSADRLSTMIGNLLDVTHLDAGTREYEPMPHDLAEITRSALADVEALAAERDLHLSLTLLDGDATLLCDGDRIRAVVANLVRNAMTFSPDNGHVRLSLARTTTPPPNVPDGWNQDSNRDPGPFLLLSIEDEGHGIADEHKHRIFDKFFQVSSGSSARAHGAGLGLYICRKVVTAHGGAIWVEDRKPGGSNFRVLLPFAPVRWADDIRPGEHFRSTRHKRRISTTAKTTPNITAR